MKKLRMFDALEAEWANCEGCALSRCRTRVVHWRGNPDARLFLIGEAPGADEDRLGRPFVGAAGRLLDSALARAGLDVIEDVFIANMVGCRPPGNRTPDRDELKACAPRLQSLLKTVSPRVLLLMGATASRLAGVTSVLAHRGEPLQVDMLCYDGEVRNWPAIATTHPSYVLRTGGAGGASFRDFTADIKAAWKLAAA